MFEIIRYTPDKANEWNKFIAKSKNGTFLFDRNYMDYHSDRFHDYSLLFYREGTSKKTPYIPIKASLMAA